MDWQVIDRDQVPDDPRARIDARIDAILRRFEPGSGDAATIVRRHLARELYELAREAVDADVEREVRDARKALDAARERQRRDDGVILEQHQALLYYADPHTWQFGCAIHVHAFDVEVVRFDDGERARDTLRSVAGAFPR